MITFNTNQIKKIIEKPFLKSNLPKIEIGDTLKIDVLIQEGNKERIQSSEGVVISMHKTGINTTLTLRRLFQGIGIEKIYLIHSPRIEKIKIVRKSKVKRAKLYYLRTKIGKAARLKQKFVV
uniref:Ribosomal protein L19 n=1 Tax=Porolithon onkodes TaxID=231751 RepID=A0A2Z2KSF0_9FLOR|nr:ribosomal protein L19 [Porolithon onkodes]ASB29679.1 ribosomal protein L19 [Porolithon onkodes]